MIFQLTLSLLNGFAAGRILARFSCTFGKGFSLNLVEKQALRTLIFKPISYEMGFFAPLFFLII